MKNETKLNIIESLKELIELVGLYTSVMGFGDREKLRDVDSKTMQKEVIPLQRNLEQALEAASKDASKKQEKEEVAKCVQFNEQLTEKVGQFVADELGVDEVLKHLKEFKSYVNRLVVDDEQLQTGTTGQGHSASSGQV